MRPGKAFELLVESILLHIGFSKVRSDGLYTFDGSAGQMIQGLAEAHNADVLLEPPVQTPFYTPTRLLIECKDYTKRVGLRTMRSALGLREDINHFDIVDRAELEVRRSNRRAGIVHDHQRYLYQVAVASMSGFSTGAQNFALTHRIPLIGFEKMPFWQEFRAVVDGARGGGADGRRVEDPAIFAAIERIAERSAVAITGSGQMLFLYRASEETHVFADQYSLFWSDPDEPWWLYSGKAKYQFQLPEQILQIWLENSATELDQKISAINCKQQFLSNMVVYYSKDGKPKIKMISINRGRLEEALDRLR